MLSHDPNSPSPGELLSRGNGARYSCTSFAAEGKLEMFPASTVMEVTFTVPPAKVVRVTPSPVLPSTPNKPASITLNRPDVCTQQQELERRKKDPYRGN